MSPLSRATTEDVLRAVFKHLHSQRVLLEGVILKPNMILPGLNSGAQRSIDTVADETLSSLRRVVPAAVAGIAFLSGGQTPELASARLNAINGRAAKTGSHAPWPLTFSFARAIQQPALAIWQGSDDTVIAAQQALYRRAHLNRLARRGEYTDAMETA